MAYYILVMCEMRGILNILVLLNTYMNLQDKLLMLRLHVLEAQALRRRSPSYKVTSVYTCSNEIPPLSLWINQLLHF